MDPSQPLANAVVAMFSAITFMGAWDGLVRRHIRLRPNEQFRSLLIDGPLAIVVGVICLLALLFIDTFAASGFPVLLAGCQTSVCVMERTVFLPFTTVFSLFILALTAVVFIPWLRGMFDLAGPFRTRMLAPGVWYREREVLTLARQALAREGQRIARETLVLELADTLLMNFHGVSPTLPAPGSTVPLPTRDMVVLRFTHSALVHKRHGAPETAQRTIIEAITPYILDKLEAAERRWPWRRRFLKMFP